MYIIQYIKAYYTYVFNELKHIGWIFPEVYGQDPQKIKEQVAICPNLKQLFKHLEVDIPKSQMRKQCYLLSSKFTHIFQLVKLKGGGSIPPSLASHFSTRFAIKIDNLKGDLQSVLCMIRHLCFARCARRLYVWNYMKYHLQCKQFFNWARWRKIRRVIRFGGDISCAFFNFLWKGFISSTSNEKEARKAYNPERGIAIFVCKYTCKHLFRTCVKRTGDHL